MLTDRNLRLLVPAAALGAVLVSATAGGLWWSAVEGEVDRAAIWRNAAAGLIVAAAVAVVAARWLAVKRALSGRAQIATVIAMTAVGLLVGIALVGGSSGSSAAPPSTAVPPSRAPVTDTTTRADALVPSTVTSLTAPQPSQKPRSSIWGSVLLALLAAALLVTVVARARRRRRPAETEAAGRGSSRRRGNQRTLGEVIEEALPRSIDELVADPDPRRAICGAYAVLLDALATAGSPRRPYETPDEHLARALLRLEIAAGPPRRLVEMFEVARFSTHVITEADRTAALRALREAQEGLRQQRAPTDDRSLEAVGP